MTSSRVIGLAAALVWGGFALWYTPLGGPLRPDEIDRYLARLAEHATGPERLARWRRFMESDTGGDFAMLNAIHLRDAPAAPPGGPAPAAETSEEILERYTAPFLRRALLRASHPVLFGRATAPALDLWGIEGADDWSHAGVVRYRSRRDLMEQAVYAASSDIHAWKVAAMEKTIAYPLDPWFHLGDPRLILGLALLTAALGAQLIVARRRGAARGERARAA